MRNCGVEFVISKKRKTIGIQVLPNCTVKIVASKKLCEAKINEILQLKAKWIDEKIAFFRENKPLPAKEYCNGEEFYFLGKVCDLKVLECEQNAVEIVENSIVVKAKNSVKVKGILTKWFKLKAKNLFLERLSVCYEIFVKKHNYPIPFLKIRKMKSRWGSLSSAGFMTLNLQLIHVDLHLIDYVIMHELCHLKYQNHGRKFYDLQSEFVPNYKDLKRKLNGFLPELKTL